MAGTINRSLGHRSSNAGSDPRRQDPRRRKACKHATIRSALLGAVHTWTVSLIAAISSVLPCNHPPRQTMFFLLSQTPVQPSVEHDLIRAEFA